MDIPPGMTIAAHYASLHKSKNGWRPAWTVDDAIIALHLYVREEGHTPRTPDLSAANGLPGFKTIVRLFGNLAGYLACLDGPPAPPPPRPHSAAHHTATRREVLCLRCDKPWLSPDPINQRVCSLCHERDDALDGLWLTGAAVVDAGAVDWLADWEED